MTLLSTPAQLMVRPFRGYAELARIQGEGRPDALFGVLRFLFVVGAYVSLTATGRLAPNELLSGMISFAYVPIVHGLSVCAATRAVTKDVPLRRAFALYMESYGPWFLLMIAVAGGSFFAPSPARLLSATGGWLVLAAVAWSAVLTLACFRSGMALSWKRAAAATFLHYLLVVGLILSYFLAAGQLLPILRR